MASGVQVADDVKIAYEEIKKDKKYRYVIFMIKDEKKIVVDSVNKRDSDYEDFLNDLQKGNSKNSLIQFLI
jgi:cofilin